MQVLRCKIVCASELTFETGFKLGCWCFLLEVKSWVTERIDGEETFPLAVWSDVLWVAMILNESSVLLSCKLSPTRDYAFRAFH